MILLLDNYDSFTFNLYQALAGLGAEVVVRRNDALTADEALSMGASAFVLSPGPGRRPRGSSRAPARPGEHAAARRAQHRPWSRPRAGGCLRTRRPCTARPASCTTAAAPCSAGSRAPSLRALLLAGRRAHLAACSSVSGLTEEGHVMGVEDTWPALRRPVPPRVHPDPAGDAPARELPGGRRGTGLRARAREQPVNAVEALRAVQAGAHLEAEQSAEVFGVVLREVEPLVRWPAQRAGDAARDRRGADRAAGPCGPT